MGADYEACKECNENERLIRRAESSTGVADLSPGWKVAKVGAGGEEANPRQGSRISAPTKNEVKSRRGEEAIFGGRPTRNRLPGAQQQNVPLWGDIVLSRRNAHLC